MGRERGPGTGQDVDEAAVMAVFRSRAAVHLTEETVVTAAFALPAAARAALRRLVERGDLVREDGDPAVYRRPQDTLGGLLRGYLLHTGLGVAFGVLAAWALRAAGVFGGSLWEPVLMFAVLGAAPAALLVLREHRYRRQRAGPGADGTAGPSA